MAYDKLVDSAQLDENLTSIANAIRAKTGNSAQLQFPNGMVDAIGGISSGGAELTAIEVYVADLTDATSYTITKGEVDGYKRQITA